MRVRVYQGSGPMDAYLVRDWLDRNGIPTMLKGEALMGLGGEIPMSDSWPSVWVREEDRERAEEAIRHFQGPTLIHPDWQCPACKEENGPAFGSCWSCGADRPALGSV